MSSIEFDLARLTPSLVGLEAWCKGEGRGGKRAGVHYTTLDAIKRYRQFLANQVEVKNER